MLPATDDGGEEKLIAAIGMLSPMAYATIILVNVVLFLVVQDFTWVDNLLNHATTLIVTTICSQ
jgi:hypothetical protein